MKKCKFLVLALVLIILICQLQTNQNVAAAEMEEVIDETPIQPRYTHLQSLALHFGVDETKGQGIAVVLSSFYSNTKYIAVRLNFQRYYNGKWVLFNSQTGSSLDSPGTWEFTVALTYPGYEYRAQVCVDLIEEDGTRAEHVELISNSVYY